MKETQEYCRHSGNWQEWLEEVAIFFLHKKYWENREDHAPNILFTKPW